MELVEMRRGNILKMTVGMGESLILVAREEKRLFVI